MCACLQEFVCMCLRQDTVPYRQQAAWRAQMHNAVGVLVRSVAPFSLDTPHTGTMKKPDRLECARLLEGSGHEYRAIPAACITSEDADMLAYFLTPGRCVALGGSHWLVWFHSPEYGL